MRLSDQAFNDMLDLFEPEDIPTGMSMEEVRQHIENFVDLVELLIQPLPEELSQLTQHLSDAPEAFSPEPSPSEETQATADHV